MFAEEIREFCNGLLKSVYSREWLKITTQL
jgi:hypothetical protein